MQPIFNFLKRILGKNFTKKIRPLGHGIKAYLASLYYGFPGKKMILIGITGTKGKTTATVLTGKMFNLLGNKAGYISSALIFDGENEILNPFKMGTIDSVKMQKYLKEMLKNGCQYAVLEMTSLGLEQNRHLGLGKFHSTVFLNIYPEHIEAHGSWENYLAAKGILFENVKAGGNFITIYNQDQQKNADFMTSRIPESITNSVNKLQIKTADFEILNYEFKLEKILKINSQIFPTNFISEVEVIDLYFAIKTIENYVPEIFTKLESILPKLYGIPGRMEWVVRAGEIVNNEKLKIKNTSNCISILVDYAHEPESMRKLLQTLKDWQKQDFFTKVIHILSCDGAGRDDWKKPVMGDLSWQYADYTILTTDNYEACDNPEEILKLLATNYDKSKVNQKYFTEINRLKSFQNALELEKQLSLLNPKEKVLIVSTGVGTEAGLTQPTGKIKWDEREVWREVYSDKM